MGFKEFMKEKLSSRKFWIAIAALVAVFSGLPQEKILPVLLIVAPYLLGQSIVDAVSKYTAAKYTEK